MRYGKYEEVTPSGADAHLDVPLSNFAVSAFSDGTQDFVADQLFPSVPVGKRSDKYYKIEKDAFLRLPPEGALRAAKTEARRVEFAVSSDAYYAHNYALANENALEDLANADTALALRANSVRLVTAQLRRAQEDRIARLVTSATNLSSGTLLTGSRKWNDFVGSDPIGDVTTAQAFIRSRTGLVPNTGVVDWDTIKVVRRHPQLLDLYKYDRGGQITMAELMEAFDLQRILVGRAIRENSREGGTSSMTNIWGNNFLVCYTEQGTGLQTTTLGVRMAWTPEGFPSPFVVERDVESGAGKRKVEVIEAGHFQDERLISPDLGYLIGTTL